MLLTPLFAPMSQEVESTYAKPESDQTTQLVAYAYWINDIICVFSVSSPTQYTDALLASRNTVFNSISFY